MKTWSLAMGLKILAAALFVCLMGCEDSSDDSNESEPYTVIAVWSTDVQEVYTFYSDDTVTVTGSGYSGSGSGDRTDFDIQWSTGIHATNHATPQGNGTYYVTWSNSRGKTGYFYAYDVSDR